MRWFTADTHFGHANIARFCGRPFVFDGSVDGALVEVTDVHAMNTAMTGVLAGAVGPEDELWVLGDYAMGNIQKTIHALDRVRCARKILVSGNHDRCHPMRQKADRWMQEYKTVFDDVIVHAELTIAGTQVAVNHFPYQGDSHDQDRFQQWRPVDTGGWLLHGHVHTAWLQRGRCVNVGIDAWGGRPVSEAELETIITGQPQNLPIIKWEPEDA